MRFGGLEILLVFAIILLFFGPKQIPKLTNTIKESISNLKSESKDEDKDVAESTEGKETVSE